MDERHLQQLMTELHEFVTKDAAQRDKDTEARHKELLTAIDDHRKATVQAIQEGFRQLADALRSR